MRLTCRPLKPAYEELSTYWMVSRIRKSDDTVMFHSQFDDLFNIWIKSPVDVLVLLPHICVSTNIVHVICLLVEMGNAQNPEQKRRQIENIILKIFNM